MLLKRLLWKWSKVKKLIFIFLLITSFGSAIAANSNQKLLCYGWTYIRDANGNLLNPNSNNEDGKYTQLIDIDIQSMKISALTGFGEIKTNLVMTDEAYFGDYAYHKEVAGTLIDNIRIHINRYTGKAFIFARSAENAGGRVNGGFTIFSGECKPQQKRF